MRKPPYSMPPFLKIYPIVFKPHTSHWSKWLYKWPHKFNSKAADFRGFPWPIPTWWWPPLELIWNPPKIFFVLSIPHLVGETRWEKEKSPSPNPRLPSGNLFQFALENGPVEPVDLPIFSRLVDLSSSFFINVYQAGYQLGLFLPWSTGGLHHLLGPYQQVLGFFKAGTGKITVVWDEDDLNWEKNRFCAINVTLCNPGTQTKLQF